MNTLSRDNCSKVCPGSNYLHLWLILPGLAASESPQSLDLGRGRVGWWGEGRGGGRGAIFPKVVKLEDPFMSLSSWGSQELRLMRLSWAQAHEELMSSGSWKAHEPELVEGSWAQAPGSLMSLSSWVPDEFKLMEASWAWAHESLMSWSSWKPHEPELIKGSWDQPC